MYHILTEKEIKKFIERYLNPNDEYIRDIKKISSIKYKGITEYLINDKYIIRMYK